MSDSFRTLASMGTMVSLPSLTAGWEANINPKKSVTGLTILDVLNDFIKPHVHHHELPVRLPISNIIILRELNPSPAELLSRAPSLLELSLESCPGDSKTKSCSELSSTRSSLRRHVRVTQLVYPLRVLPEMRRSSLAKSSTSRRRVTLIHQGFHWAVVAVQEAPWASSSLAMP